MVEYLQTAAVILGEKIFLESFFQQETVTEEEYLENLGELNRKAFSDAVKEAKDFLSLYHQLCLALMFTSYSE